MPSTGAPLGTAARVMSSRGTVRGRSNNQAHLCSVIDTCLITFSISLYVVEYVTNYIVAQYIYCLYRQNKKAPHT